VLCDRLYGFRYLHEECVLAIIHRSISSKIIHLDNLVLPYILLGVCCVLYGVWCGLCGVCSSGTLHEECVPAIIHRSISSKIIHLDDRMQAQDRGRGNSPCSTPSATRQQGMAAHPPTALPLHSQTPPPFPTSLWPPHAPLHAALHTLSCPREIHSNSFCTSSLAVHLAADTQPHRLTLVPLVSAACPLRPPCPCSPSRISWSGGFDVQTPPSTPCPESTRPRADGVQLRGGAAGAAHGEETARTRAGPCRPYTLPPTSPQEDPHEPP